MKFRGRIKIWLRVLFSLIRVPFGVRARVLTPDKTADAVISGRSLIRLGDGELRILRGLSIGFEEPHAELIRELTQIKDDFSRMGNECPYLLCVPRKFMNASALSLAKKRSYVSSWAEARLYFKKNFSRSVTYGDAFIFSKDYTAESDRILASLSRRAIVFVHNSEGCFYDFARRHGGDVHFVRCPERSAYEKIDEIESEIYSLTEKNGYTPDGVSLIVSAGPCAKPLVHRACKRGYHAIDAGHLFDYPLEDMK